MSVPTILMVSRCQVSRFQSPPSRDANRNVLLDLFEFYMSFFPYAYVTKLFFKYWADNSTFCTKL